MKKTMLLLVVVALSLATVPAFAGTTCPSYGSYSNLCSGAYNLFGNPSIEDCSACCSEHAQQQICSCTDPASYSSCDSKVNRNEADCYAKCDAIVACSPADPYCYFAPTPPGSQP